MQSRFDEILASILPERPVLLAVSGGVDSMVMADLFMGSPLSGHFEVAHCNFHGVERTVSASSKKTSAPVNIHFPGE